MSILEGATDVAILGGTFIAAAAGSNILIHHGGGPGFSSAFKDLSAVVAHRALPDSAARLNAPRCHRNTRTRQLNKFEQWILGEANEFTGKSLIWLNGGAGAGKSAIMQTLIERCAYHEVILGAFFFSRADPSRNHIEALIPTLAYQVVRTCPAAMTVLEPIILSDPLIFTASPYTQAYQLLVQPLLYLIEAGILETHTPVRRIFLIDGLDECSDPQQQALVIQVVACILNDYRIPISFLIASRPEMAITCAFQKEKRLLEYFTSISLHNDEDAESDIRRFIEDSFLDILDNHPWRMHITFPWPSADSVNRLVKKSSGHFIFASTAMKFIASSDEHPGRALAVVEGIVPSRTGSPFAALDALYTHILTQARYSDKVIDILKHCYFSIFPNSIAAVSYIQGISAEDIELFLSDVQSLISLMPNRTADLTITPAHASLCDFLTSKERSQELHIEKSMYHASLLERYFQLVDNGPSPTSLFSFQGDTTRHLIYILAQAIVDSEDIDLCLSLIKRHSCYSIWNFCVESCAYNDTSRRGTKELIACAIYDYMSAIRKFSITIRNESLFLDQFAQYLQMLIKDLVDDIYRKPQHRIIAAILFSSNRTGLYWAFYFLWKWSRTFGIDRSYEYLFFDAEVDITQKELDLSFEAIRCSPFSKVSWGYDLASLMKLVLEQLTELSRPSSIPYISPHKRWLRKNKPLKQIALGSPMLSSAMFSNLFTLTRPNERFAKPAYHTCWTPSANRIWKYWHGYRIAHRKQKCLTLLKAIIFYLRKSNCTIQLVNMARKSLPIAAQWYPRSMKRARAEMDAYVRRWEVEAGSPRFNAQMVNLNNAGYIS